MRQERALVEVDGGLVDRARDVRVGGEVHHDLVSPHRPGQRAEVFHVARDQAEPGVVTVRRQVPLPARAEVVEDRHLRHRLIGQQAVDQVAADETGSSHHEVPRRRGHRPDPVNVSHRAPARLRQGCETSRCQRTAHTASVCGVTRSGNRGGITTASSAHWAVTPPSRPTIP